MGDGGIMYDHQAVQDGSHVPEKKCDHPGDLFPSSSK